MSNQTSSNSTFKMPMAPPVYASQPETLLFQDIIEEKTILLHNILSEFLKVHPYRKFDIEFNAFLKRVKRLILDGQRTGANVSRIANSSQIAPLYGRPSTSFNIYRPSTSFNYRPPTTMSMVSSNHHSTLRLPENNFQHIEEPSEHSNPFKPPDVSFQPIEPRELSNPFKRPDVICIQPKVVLSRIDQSLYKSHVSPSTSATVIEVSQHDSVTVKENNTHEIPQQSTSQSSRNQPTVHNAYSDVTFEENTSVSHLHQNENQNDENNSIESLLEGVGFKIIVGSTENNNETSKKSMACQLKNNQSNVEKFLSMWSINMKLIKSASQKYVIILTGNLLGDDKSTVVEKRHEAGIIEGRKTANLVKTKNGLYRLVGNIIGGSPNELYQACLEIHGIPRTWRNIVKQLTGVEKKTENVFDFSMNSPLGPTVRQTKPSLKLNESVTRKGTAYTKYMSLDTQKINKKRKLSEYDETENNKNKHPKFHEKLPPLLSSTPKKPKKQPSVFETPSQILKNKFKQNVYNNSNNKLSRVNNSININKKRQSQTKEQVNLFLKPKTPEKTLLSDINTTKSTKQMTGNSTVSSTNSSRESKQTSINNSKKINSFNSNDTKLKNKTPENSSITKRRSLNSTNQQSKINSINSTNSNSISKSKSKTNVSITPQKKFKAVKKTTPKMRKKRMAPKQKVIEQKKQKNIVSGTKNNNTCKKTSLPKTKICDKSMNNTNTVKEKLKKKKTKQVLSPNGGVDLFSDINHADYGNVTDSDFNAMESPSKLSVISGTDKSRSVTPPFFGDQWGSSGKSMIISEPPTPLSKSGTAKALKRVKAPKITLEDEIKFNKKKITKGVDYKTVTNKIDKMLQFGNVYDEEDD